jgi:hypothetical protein
LGEHAGDALTDPAAAACDERTPPFEFKIHSVPSPSFARPAVVDILTHRANGGF